MSQRLVKSLRDRFAHARHSMLRRHFHCEPSANDVLTVASYNVHKCVGTDGLRNPARVQQVLLELDADVIALQEADMRFGTRKGLLDLGLLKEAGYESLPHRKVGSQSHGWHGNMLLFRQGAVVGVQRLNLPGLEPRGALITDLDLPHGSLRIIAAHLGLLRRSRRQQVSLLLEAANPQPDRPVIVMGDMNEWRLGERSSLHLLAPQLGPLDQMVASFPASFPILPLDRVLVGGNLRLQSIEAHVSPVALKASDHLPVKARIEIMRGAEETAARHTDVVPLRISA